MKTTSAFKWLLIFLVPLTFIWKLMPEHQPVHEMPGGVMRFLASHEFRVMEQTPTDNVMVVRATKDDCSMIVAEASADGASRHIMRHLAAAMDQHFVVFRGSVYSGQPTWLTITQEWWTRFLRKIGISQFQSWPIMVAATASCNAQQIPWAELSSGG